MWEAYIHAYLFHHLVFENFFLVDDLNGNTCTSINMFCILDLGKSAFSQSLSNFILTNLGANSMVGTHLFSCRSSSSFSFSLSTSFCQLSNQGCKSSSSTFSSSFSSSFSSFSFSFVFSLSTSFCHLSYQGCIDGFMSSLVLKGMNDHSNLLWQIHQAFPIFHQKGLCMIPWTCIHCKSRFATEPSSTRLSTLTDSLLQRQQRPYIHIHTVEVYESKESAFTKASPTHHLIIIFNFVPHALLLQCTSGKKLTQPLSYLFVPTYSHQTANLDEENLRWLWNIWSRIKGWVFFMNKLHVFYLYFRKHKTLLEQVQSTKEQIQQRKQKPESKASLRNCSKTFRCSKRDKFRSERASRRRMRRRSPGLLPLDVRLLPEELPRRRPVTEGVRTGPAFDTPAPTLDSESTFGPG